MAVVNYTVVNGEVIAEKRGGVRSCYVPDPLGSTRALLDNTQTITDSFDYWPYGEVKPGRTGTTATPFQYGGTLGYYQDSGSRTYVRRRVLRPSMTRWQTEDPVWNGWGQSLFSYGANSPATYTDPTGWVPSAGPECKEAQNVNAAIALACKLISTAPIIKRLSPHYQTCITNWCNTNGRIKCGDPECASNWRNGVCERGHTDNGQITICTGTICQPKCLIPGTNCMLTLAASIIHEAMHTCGMNDRDRDGKHKSNPCEDIGCACIGVPGDEPGYGH
jgi:RHS repeat-associated protein